MISSAKLVIFVYALVVFEHVDERVVQTVSVRDDKEAFEIRLQSLQTLGEAKEFSFEGTPLDLCCRETSDNDCNDFRSPSSGLPLGKHPTITVF